MKRVRSSPPVAASSPGAKSRREDLSDLSSDSDPDTTFESLSYYESTKDTSSSTVVSAASPVPAVSPVPAEPAAQPPAVDDGFQTVSRRRRQPPAQQGPPAEFRARRHPATRPVSRRPPLSPPTAVTTVLFRPSEADATLHRLKLSAILRELKPAPVQAFRRIRRGGLAVDFQEGFDVEPLLSSSTLCGFNIKASLPASGEAVVGTLRCAAEDAEEFKELYQEHENPSIKAVRALGNRGLFVVTFAAAPLPASILFCFQVVRVSPFFRSPLRCFKCQRFGHVAANCRSKPACKQCGSAAANHRECSAAARCANCGGPHAADFRDCPHRVYELRVNKHQAQQQCSRETARAAVSSSYADAVRGRPATEPAKPSPVPQAAAVRVQTPVQVKVTTVAHTQTEDISSFSDSRKDEPPATASASVQTDPVAAPTPAAAKSAAAAKPAHTIPPKMFKPLKRVVESLVMDPDPEGLEHKIVQIYRYLEELHVLWQ